MLPVAQAAPLRAVGRGEGLSVRITGLESLLVELLERLRLPDAVWRCLPPPTAEELARGHLPDKPSPFFTELGGALAKRCYHPSRLLPPPAVSGEPRDYARLMDPAAPHVAVQYVSRLVLRNAMGLALALGALHLRCKIR